MDNEQEIIKEYKNHTGTYICNKYNITKNQLNKILDTNNITHHTPAEATHLSALENPNQGTTGTKYYNNGTEQGRFKPGEQPEGWKEGGLKFTKDQIELMLNKRGNRSPMLTQNGYDNYFKSIKDKYGVDNIAKSDIAKQNTIITNNNKYGVDYAIQDPIIRKKAETTCLSRYGSTYYIGSKECRDKYGADNLLKMLETKKKNHTFNTSKPEEEYYKMLCDKYGEHDIERNYNKDPRYPFLCDFYIKSLDLFIECNYSWTHGGRPYDVSDEDCLKQLVKWQDGAAEGKEYYKIAINTWTKRDVKKRNTALKNKLNYIEIFN